MGGMNEQMVSPPAGSTVQKSPVRIHENNGEIHFHDDAAGFKVAINKHDMLKAYKDADNNGWAKPISLISKHRDAVVNIQRHEVIDPATGLPKELDLEISVTRIAATGGNFSKLKKALGL